MNEITQHLFFLYFFDICWKKTKSKSPMQAITVFSYQASMYASRTARRVTETLTLLDHTGHPRKDIATAWQKQVAQLPPNTVQQFTAAFETLKSLQHSVLEAINSRKRLLSVKIRFLTTEGQAEHWEEVERSTITHSKAWLAKFGAAKEFKPLKLALKHLVDAGSPDWSYVVPFGDK
jgi:hypothetical protein